MKPVVLSILLASIFYPLVKKLNNKFRIPWLAGIILVYAVFLIIFTGIFNILTSSIISIAKSYPRYEERFRLIYRRLQDSLAANSDSSLFQAFLNFDKEQSLLENLSAHLNILPMLRNFTLNFTTFTVSFFKSTFLVLLLSIFLLLEMKFIKAKVSAAFSNEDSARIHEIMNRIARDTTHYISIKSAISLATGILVFLSCIIAGVDFPLVWAFIAFILNFVPTFGSIISWAATSVFAFMQSYPSPFPIIFIASSILIINIVLGNIVEPKIEGENLGVSPFVILVSLSLWGWLWGFLGLILAVPLVVIIKIFCENISYLRPIGILFGSGKNL